MGCREAAASFRTSNLERTLPAAELCTQPIAISRKRLVLVLAGIMLGMSLGALDQTVVGTAMPRVIAELNGMQHYAWVFAAYMLASTVVIPIYGKLSDIYGRRPFFLGGMLVFLVGSALSGASQDMTQLILFRAVQGLGAGAIMPMVQAIAGDLFPPIERGKWQGVIMSLWGLATIVGPAVGGWITDYWGWRWVFYVNLPVGALAIATAGIALPAVSRYTTHRIDWCGAGLLVLAAVPLLLAFSWAGTEYAWLSVQIIGLLLFSTVMFAMFLWLEGRAPEPIVNPSFFRNGIFAVSVLATFLLSAGMFSVLVYTPLFVQGVMGESATGSGAVMTPHMLAFALSNIVGGQVLSRTGRYKALTLGCFATATFGMALLALMDMKTTHEIVTRNVVVMGLGLGIMMTLFTIVVQNAFPSGALGQVTANLQFFRSIGATVGTAILGTVLTSNFQAGFQAALPASLRQAVPTEQLASLQNPQVLLSAEAMENIRAGFINFGPEGTALFDQAMQAIRTSLASAISTVFAASAVAMGLGCVVAFFLRELPLGGSQRSQHGQ